VGSGVFGQRVGTIKVFAVLLNLGNSSRSASWAKKRGRIADLHGRLHRGAYRAKPTKRIYIPKPDGRQRPIGITSLEDKVVQKAVVWVMQCIYEQDFVGFSYGFRPGKSQHQALDALTVALKGNKVNWVLDADVEGFGRFAIERREERGEGKSETFDFLGFTHRCGKTRSHGWFTIHRESIAKRMRAKLAAIRELLRRRRHWFIGPIGRWLSRVIQGWYNYHAIPGNMIRLQQFRDEIIKLWLGVLRRRSQRHRWTWTRMQRMVRRLLPTPKILHPYPDQRFRDRLKAGAV